eukprot:Rmarinus@m.19281
MTTYKKRSRAASRIQKAWREYLQGLKDIRTETDDARVFSRLLRWVQIRHKLRNPNVTLVRSVFDGFLVLNRNKYLSWVKRSATEAILKSPTFPEVHAFLTRICKRVIRDNLSSPQATEVLFDIVGEQFVQDYFPDVVRCGYILEPPYMSLTTRAEIEHEMHNMLVEMAVSEGIQSGLFESEAFRDYVRISFAVFHGNAPAFLQSIPTPGGCKEEQDVEACARGLALLLHGAHSPEVLERVKAHFCGRPLPSPLRCFLWHNRLHSADMFRYCQKHIQEGFRKLGIDYREANPSQAPIKSFLCRVADSALNKLPGDEPISTDLKSLLYNVFSHYYLFSDTYSARAAMYIYPLVVAFPFEDADVLHAMLITFIGGIYGALRGGIDLPMSMPVDATQNLSASTASANDTTANANATSSTTGADTDCNNVGESAKSNTWDCTPMKATVGNHHSATFHPTAAAPSTRVAHRRLSLHQNPVSGAVPDAVSRTVLRRVVKRLCDTDAPLAAMLGFHLPGTNHSSEKTDNVHSGENRASGGAPVQAVVSGVSGLVAAKRKTSKKKGSKRSEGGEESMSGRSTGEDGFGSEGSLSSLSKKSKKAKGGAEAEDGGKAMKKKGHKVDEGSPSNEKEKAKGKGKKKRDKDSSDHVGDDAGDNAGDDAGSGGAGNSGRIKAKKGKNKGGEDEKETPRIRSPKGSKKRREGLEAESASGVESDEGKASSRTGKKKKPKEEAAEGLDLVSSTTEKKKKKDTSVGHEKEVDYDGDGDGDGGDGIAKKKKKGRAANLGEKMGKGEGEFGEDSVDDGRKSKKGKGRKKGVEGGSESPGSESARRKKRESTAHDGGAENKAESGGAEEKQDDVDAGKSKKRKTKIKREEIDGTGEKDLAKGSRKENSYQATVGEEGLSHLSPREDMSINLAGSKRTSKLGQSSTAVLGRSPSEKETTGDRSRTSPCEWVVRQWLVDAFVGHLPLDTLLFVWDQALMHGWGVFEDVCIAVVLVFKNVIRDAFERIAVAAEKMASSMTPGAASGAWEVVLPRVCDAISQRARLLPLETLQHELHPLLLHRLSPKYQRMYPVLPMPPPPAAAAEHTSPASEPPQPPSKKSKVGSDVSKLKSIPERGSVRSLRKAVDVHSDADTPVESLLEATRVAKAVGRVKKKKNAGKGSSAENDEGLKGGRDGESGSASEGAGKKSPKGKSGRGKRKDKSGGEGDVEADHDGDTLGERGLKKVSDGKKSGKKGKPEDIGVKAESSEMAASGGGSRNPGPNDKGKKKKKEEKDLDLVDPEATTAPSAKKEKVEES